MKVRVLEELVGEAQRVTGLSAFYSESFREGLEILVSEINRLDSFTPDGVAHFEKRAVSSLASRLKVDEYIRRNPDVLDAPIKAPVVVLGMPRTGSTLLNNLLATDPRRRSPLGWEYDDPTPPPAAGELFTGPRAMAALDAEAQSRAANPKALRFRPVSAIFPVECAHIQAHDFKSLFWEAHGPMPAYSEWILSCDMTSAYDYHRRFLQVLQHRAPGVWNLKMPSHAVHIEWLLKAYPDARLIWTHRDPFAATGSLFSLIANTHERTMGKADRLYIAKNYPQQMSEHVDRMRAARERIPPSRLYDHSYAEIVRDPIGAVRKIYAWLGDEFTPEVQSGMRRWLDQNPQGKWVTHAYKLDEFGLTIEDLRPHFAAYLSQHDIELEGRGR